MSLIVEKEIEYLRRQFRFAVEQIGVQFMYRYPLNNAIDVLISLLLMGILNVYQFTVYSKENPS